MGFYFLRVYHVVADKVIPRIRWYHLSLIDSMLHHAYLIIEKRLYQLKIPQVAVSLVYTYRFFK